MRLLLLFLALLPTLILAADPIEQCNPHSNASWITTFQEANISYIHYRGVLTLTDNIEDWANDPLQVCQRTKNICPEVTDVVIVQQGIVILSDGCKF